MLIIMKYIKYNVLILFSSLLFSCTDFLDRTPLDEISNQTFWNTEEDMKVYNNKLYTSAANSCQTTGIMVGFGEGAYNSSYLFFDCMGNDIASTLSGDEFFTEVRAGIRPIPEGNEFYGYQGWNFLREVNFGLQNFNRTSVAQDVKNKYIAEARLFRGWFYAVKVQRYGDVQWINKPLDTNSEELFGKRNLRVEVMDSVINDLNFATDNLPENWGDGGAPGRLNKWCALLIKSRLCLFEGTYRKYHNLPDYERWIKIAKEAALEIINNGPYKIYKTDNPIDNEDYAWLQRQVDLSGNCEVMYWQRFKDGILNNNTIRYFVQDKGATRDFIESYLCTDGLPITQSPLYKGDGQIEDVFENRDPRLRQSILHPADKAKRKFFLDDKLTYPRLKGMAGGKISPTGYHIIKPYNYDNEAGNGFKQSEQSAVVLRFAEVLLNYAEASAELGELTQKDLDITINQLRDRVNMPHMELGKLPIDPEAAKEGVSALIYEIRRERRVELFCEGFRYNDLMRWKLGRKLAEPSLGILWDNKAKTRYVGAKLVETTVDATRGGKEYVNAFKGTQWENAVFNEDKDYLWPIPLSIIAENPNVGQNPEWK